MTALAPLRASAALVVAAVLVLAGCSAGAPPAETAPEPARGAEQLSAGALQDPAGAAPPATSAATPVSVSIPAIGVSSSLESLAVDGTGELQAPVDYDLAGWYADGVVPGAVGPSIIAGHVDSPTGPAVFLRLAELQEGDEIEVALSDGSTRTFRMTGSAQSEKATFPTSDVYGPVPTPQLRLITCAGDFDSAVGSYSDNLIVFAELVP